MPDNTPTNPGVGSDAFLKRMRDQFALDAEQERENREEARKDIQFRAGDQWDAKAAKARREADRPVLVFNKTQQFVAQVANEARQNRPTIKFSPADSGADVDTAKVYEELGRAIQYNSRAGIAYENAVDGAAGNAFAYFRLLADYCDSETFDQELKIAPIMDPFSVYGVMIPTALRRPVTHAFVVETITREEYTRQYGDSKLAQWGFDSEIVRLSGGDWIGKEMVRIAEYWWIDYERRTLTSADGAKTRVVQVPKVRFCKTNGVEVFEDTVTDWPASRIPIYAVLGSQVVLDGEVKLFSLIRWIRDPQVMINFAKTRIVETLATAPVSPFIGPKGFMGNQKGQWERLNQSMTAALEYELVTLPNGQVAPPPQRQTFEPPIAALSAFVAQEEEDLKSGTGIYDARLGSRGNETSGIAIQRRNQQSETANFHFIDNLSRAQEECGADMAEVMPVFYDTPRWLRVIGEDETERMVRVNEQYQDTDGKVKAHMLGAGKYDVRIITGPAYTTKRQETADMLAGVFQANPQLLNVMGDIFFRNSDAAGSEEMAERMKKWISTQAPGLIEDKKQAVEIPPQLQGQIQALMQQHEQLTQVVEQQADEIRTRKFEVESRERIAAMQEETKRTIALAQLQSQEGLELLRQEIGQLRSGLEMRHAMEMKAADQQHQGLMAAANMEQQRATQEADQQHQQHMADRQAASEAAMAAQEPPETEQNPA